jgi:ribosome-binding protein aMBF1 (putative translation factor)
MLLMEKVRADRGMRKADLSRASVVQASIIGWIESGRFIPYDSQLKKIAAALDWQGEPAELMGEVGDDGTD